MSYSSTLYFEEPTTGSPTVGATIVLKEVDEAGTLTGLEYTGAAVTGKAGVYEFVNVKPSKYKAFKDGTEDKSFGGDNGTPFPEMKKYRTLSSLSDVPEFLGQIGRYNSKLYVSIALSGTMWEETHKLPAAYVSPSQMAAQLKTLTSLTNTPDYIGQIGNYGGVKYVAISLTGTMWEKLPTEIAINEILTTGQQKMQINKYINSVFAGYNNDNNLFSGFNSSTASAIPNDETCIFPKSSIRNIHRFSVPSLSASGGVQSAAADFDNNGYAGCFGAWFRKSSLQAFNTQGINFQIYQIGSPTKTNGVIVTGANLYTVGYINTNTSNGYTVTVEVIAERNGWIYITVSFDTVLVGYTQTRLIMTWVNSLGVSGFNVDIINPTYLFGVDYVDPSIIYPENNTQADLMSTTLDKINELQRADRNIPNRPLSICLAGTSITDQTHVLVSESDYFTSVVADYIFNVLADTVKYNQPLYSGNRSIVYNPKMFKNAGYKLSGAGAYVEFELYGDELMLIQAIERTETGAALIQLHVDGVLYDTFSNYNTRPKGTGATATWTGNGTKRKFSLGKNFCYNPRSLTVNGVSKTVKHNTYSPPVNYSTFDGNDALLIRKYEVVSGETVVNNYLWFLNPPANGHAISLTYDYGENIQWTKSTLGEISGALTQISITSGGNLESFEGDDTTDVNSSTFAAAGLDFRYSNPDACKTWKFGEKKKRTFRFTISGLDPRGSGTPYFIFNAATNRSHRLMNAGIFGYSARELANNNPANDLRTYFQIQDFKPDLVVMEHGANDDNSRLYNYPIAFKESTSVTEAVIRNYPVRFIKVCSYIGADNYTLDSAFLSISAITKNTVTLDNTGVTYDSTPAAGDVIRIGTHRNSNKEFVCRVISAWDNSTKKATFKEPLLLTDFIGITSLSDLVGAQAVIYRLDTFETALNTIVDGLRDANPDVQIALCTSGMPNANTQDLDAYAAKTRKIAFDKGTFFGSNYKAIKDFTFTQAFDVLVYLTSANNTTSSGASSYTLVTGAGANPQASYQFFNWSVLVDGVERYGDGTCYIEGGKRGTFSSLLAANALTATDWENANGKQSNDVLPTKLYFTSNVPTAGATILVKYSSVKVSYDDSHPDTVNGFRVYGAVLIGAIKKMLQAFKIS